jgi:flagellar basal-body rod protein FlgB
MSDPLESITTAALSLALDAASLRHQAIAANIANHATEGYVPQKVDFEAQMQEARRSLDATGRLDPVALASVRPALRPVTAAGGQPTQVRIDQEMADLAQNAVQFQALAKGLARHFSILSIAVNDGKR